MRADEYDPSQRMSRPYHGRVEDFHVSFEGVAYDPENEGQDVFVVGTLSPSAFDPDNPSAGAPPGGWPLLLILPADGSVEMEEPETAALDVLEEARAALRVVSSFIRPGPSRR